MSWKYCVEDSLQMVDIIAQCPVCTFTECSHHWQALFESLIAQVHHPTIVSVWLGFHGTGMYVSPVLLITSMIKCVHSLCLCLFVSACVKVHVLYWKCRQSLQNISEGAHFQYNLSSFLSTLPPVPVPISTPHLSPTRSSLSMWRHSGRTLAWYSAITDRMSISWSTVLDSKSHCHLSACRLWLDLTNTCSCSFMSPEKLREIAQPDFKPSEQVSATCIVCICLPVCFNICIYSETCLRQPPVGQF